MFKKFFSIMILGAIGMYVVAETPVGDYVQEKYTAWKERREERRKAKASPMDELNRIRKEVQLIDKDIEKVKSELAETNVKIRSLKRSLPELRDEVAHSEKSIKAHGDVLLAASEKDRIVWGNRTVSYADAKELLESEVKRHNDVKNRLRERERMLASQEENRDLIDRQLQEMITQKEVLASAVMELESEIRLAQVEQMRSKYQNDGTRMASIKQSLAELRDRVAVQRESLLVAQHYDRSPASKKTVTQILSGMNATGPAERTIEEVKVITQP